MTEKGTKSKFLFLITITLLAIAFFSGCVLKGYKDNSNATYNISGYVKDANDMPISAAIIQDNIFNYNTTTDDSGYYILGGYPNGVYNITATKSGYISNKTEIKINGSDINANITLSIKFISETKKLLDIINVSKEKFEELNLFLENNITYYVNETDNIKLFNYSPESSKKLEEFFTHTKWFTTNASKLYQGIDGLSSNSSEFEVENLPYQALLDSHRILIQSISELKNEADESQSEQLMKIQNSSNSTIEALIDIFKVNLDKKIKNSQKEREESFKELENCKNKLRYAILFPFAVTIIIGALTGYINVSDWKKKVEYYRLYTRKIRVMNPIMRALLISTIILMIVIAVVLYYNGLAIINYLI